MRILIASMLIIFVAVGSSTHSIADEGENTGSKFPITVDESLHDNLASEDLSALELGRKVLAVRKAIRNPSGPHAMSAVTELGHDQRYYVMVRGWLAYQLQGDMSILDANKEQTRKEIKERIEFLQKAIWAIDLE